MPNSTFFIHGFGGASGLWKWQQDAFQSSIALDLPGHGANPWHGETLEDMACSVLVRLQQDEVSCASFVASSFGGLVVLKLYEIAPEIVERVIFVGSLPRFTSDASYPAGLDSAKIQKLAWQLSGDVGVVLDMFFRSLFTRLEREGEQYSRIRDLRRSLGLPDRAALLAILKMLETEDLRSVFAGMKCPVAFIVGDQDPLCPLDAVNALLEMRKDALIKVMKGCGHFPFLSKPDDFNRQLASLLTAD